MVTEEHILSGLRLKGASTKPTILQRTEQEFLPAVLEELRASGAALSTHRLVLRATGAAHSTQRATTGKSRNALRVKREVGVRATVASRPVMRP